jgi:hypothetical protein
LKPKSSQSSGHTSFTKEGEEVQTNVVCEEAEGKYFLGQERSTGGGIPAKRDHNNVRDVLQNTNKIS